MKVRRIRSTALAAACGLLAGVFGCVELTPPPESVLEGTWELVASDPLDPQLTHLYVKFDSNGDLSQVQYTFVDRTAVTLNYPPGSVRVEADQVHISATTSGNGVTFDGTLDSATAPTRAAGSQTSNLIFGDVQFSVSQGEASLVRQ